MKDDGDKQLMYQLFQELVEEQKKIEQKYPSDIPIEVCRHAIISGILIENSSGFKVNDYIPLMVTEYEKLYIWTHTKDEYSSIVSEVSTEVKKLNYWKNLGYIIRFALAYHYFFEHIIKIHCKIKCNNKYIENAMVNPLWLSRRKPYITGGFTNGLF
ncbi:hypothetical protein [Tepidibacillus fermentans]|uniref:Uncharacterized protein n=1 Tax=Tepidibacillus fermentans TaxID=1281767 RepID=A0A4R3K774_9BACI|nr:hypothetical protein [Tepidibacillus fermentans]TCS78628.1 hypothetical protein EDD72_1266 [Tepidibacillus fermentans]